MDTNEIDDILRCAICRGQLTDPRLLDCRHVFCFNCIDQHFKHENKNCAPCPICRALYWPNRRSPKNLPEASIVLQNLLTTRKDSQHICESDSCTKMAPFVCIKCHLWLCKECKTTDCNSVEQTTSSRGHQGYRPEFMDTKLSAIVLGSLHKSCRFHQIETVAWFCSQCNVLLCDLCRTNKHLHHDVVDMKQQAVEFRKHFEVKLRCLRQKGHKHKRGMKALEKCMEKRTGVDLNSIIDTCQSDYERCDDLVKEIKQVLVYGSDHVVVETFIKLEKEMDNELRKCPLLLDNEPCTKLCRTFRNAMDVRCLLMTVFNIFTTIFTMLILNYFLK